MTDRLADLLLPLSDAIAARVAASAPLIAAVEVARGPPLSGILWSADAVVTVAHTLPEQADYRVSVAGGGRAIARLAGRDAGIAVLRLDDEVVFAEPRAAHAPAVGALALVLAASEDGGATARLTIVHRAPPPRTGSGSRSGDHIVLDLPASRAGEGGAVIDADGGLLGMTIAGPYGQARVVPFAAIARAATPLLTSMNGQGGGWLGAELQPVAVPRGLRASAGQDSGRMVVSLERGGPAEQAGVRLNDVLLALDGNSVKGPRAIRALLGPDRIGRRMQVRLIRDGAVRSVSLVVAPRPTDQR